MSHNVYYATLFGLRNATDKAKTFPNTDPGGLRKVAQVTSRIQGTWRNLSQGIPPKRQCVPEKQLWITYCSKLTTLSVKQLQGARNHGLVQIIKAKKPVEQGCG